MAATPDELQACNGLITEIITVDGDVHVGTLIYSPDEGDFSVIIFEPDCCEMTIMTPDDVAYMTC